MIYTDPITGRYSVRLAQGDYTMSVSSDYPGYQPSTEQLSISSSNQDHDVKLAADLTACTAPGYDRSGGTMRFTGWTAATPHAGWTINGDRLAVRQPRRPAAAADPAGVPSGRRRQLRGR